MKFFDKVEIKIQAWKWWDGVVASRREKYVDYWGPAGWDWGNWGNVIFQALEWENTLLKYRYNKSYKAHYWDPGKWKDKYWKSAEDLFLPVPLGTIIKDKLSWKILHQFIENWDTYIAAKWWKWWVWNIHFKNSQRQFPWFALFGEPGEQREIILELQLLWDLALIGTPSVWKSSIINNISNVKTKTADYPFTTIVPNIWVVSHKKMDFTVVDVPGLIEWANEWKWLWNEFLRHILKARILAFVLDLWRYESWLKEFNDLFTEIILYINKKFIWSNDYWKVIKKIKCEIIVEWDEILLEVKGIFSDKEEKVILRKLLYFILNKYDIINDEEILALMKKTLIDLIKNHKTPKFPKSKIKPQLIEKNLSIMSAVSRHWIKELLDNIVIKMESFKTIWINDFDIIQKDEIQQDYIEDITKTERNLLIEEWYIEQDDSKYIKIREVYNKDLWRLAYIIPWWNAEAEDWFWNTIEKEWILKTLQKKWVKIWDVLKIKSIYAWEKDKYIMRD